MVPAAGTNGRTLWIRVADVGRAGAGPRRNLGAESICPLVTGPERCKRVERC